MGSGKQKIEQRWGMREKWWGQGQVPAARELPYCNKKRGQLGGAGTPREREKVTVFQPNILTHKRWSVAGGTGGSHGTPIQKVRKTPGERRNKQ